MMHIPNPEDFCELETDRLVLRPMTEGDAEMVVRWRNSEHVASMSFESKSAQLNLEDHISWFSKSRKHRIDYVIEEKEERLPIGSLSFSSYSHPDFDVCGELGKYIGEESYLGKGYAYEATARWIQFGFENLGLHCVVARTKRSNTSNIHINKKLGFSILTKQEKNDQSLEGFFLMNLTRSEWSKNQITSG